MSQQSVISPDDQGATFVELFFDLVFVFAITQVTHYVAHHLDAQGILRSLVVFWLIWWGWTQFTWALNAANTDHHGIRAWTLVATGVAFAMAASVEHAFSAEGNKALWFGLSYIGVRALGLGLYYRVARSNRDQETAVAAFAFMSIGGLVAVLIGAFADPSVRVWIWLVAAVLDMLAAARAGRWAGWKLHAGHFAERHGLIVIIALGESLIVAGSAVASDASGALLAVGALAVLMTCLLWWTYYGWIQGLLEHRLLDEPLETQGPLARDAYSLGHFPLVCGIIALAVGFEAAFHPSDYSVTQTAVAVGAGLTLFLGSTAWAVWRSEGCILWTRIIVLGLCLGVLALAGFSAPLSVLVVGCAGLGVIVAVEQISVRRRLVQH